MAPKHSARRIAPVVALVALAACQDAAGPTDSVAPEASVSAARSPQAQDRLEQVFQRISPEVMDLPGTVFSDNDERIGKVVIGVDNMGAARGIQNAMKRLGIADADYAIELTEPVQFAATLRDVVNPKQGGLQLHFTQYVCTLGFNATQDGQNGFVTNSHCTAKQGGVENTVYYQPASSQSGVIATEVEDPTYGRISGCPKGKNCRWSDASRARYATGVSFQMGRIAKTVGNNGATGENSGSLTIHGTEYFTITGVSKASPNIPVGTKVHKVGRTTGWTSGTVERTCVNTSVSGSKVHLFCQTFVYNPSATIVNGGDSGSGAFVRDGSTNNVTLVGILWGSSGSNRFLVSPLHSIERELGTLAVQ